MNTLEKIIQTDVLKKILETKISILGTFLYDYLKTVYIADQY